MSGGANHSRLTSLTYPNGRVVTSDYGSGLNDTISRLNSLKDGSTTLEGYSYLGLGAVVERLHPESGIDLSYVKKPAESVGDAGDQYTGLDRFGRVVGQRWLETSSGTAVDEYEYGYDRDSNRTYRDNRVATSFGEVYSYDGLNQLVATERGTLNGTKTGVTGTPSLEQSWNYDALGNWDSVTTNGTTQTRSHNQQNEITGVSGATTPTYDANGNMTTDETGKQFVYDAWNFLKVVKNSGGTTLETFNYDALKRKIQIVGGSTTDLYYSAAWQVIEERASGVAVVSYVWSPVYVDAMISRDRDTDNNGSLDERLYVLHDANFNVTGLVTTGSSVVERFTYEPFGKVEIRDSSWAIKSGGTGYAWLYLHQGGRLDSVSGLYAFRFREYSPTLGRWMTNDPIEYRGGDTNLFDAYYNNPVDSADSMGLTARPKISTKVIGSLPKTNNHNGILIEVTVPKGSTVRMIQFVKIHAELTCTLFKSCRSVSRYLSFSHTHGGKTVSTSHPDKPTWIIDDGGRDTPEYPLLDNRLFGPDAGSQSNVTHELYDWPQIATEMYQEIQASIGYKNLVDSIKKNLRSKYPQEGGVNCALFVKADFVTYIIVDGKVVSSIRWSVGPNSGPSIGNPEEPNKELITEHLKEIRKVFPEYALPTFK